jgi:hypothetical protein
VWNKKLHKDKKTGEFVGGYQVRPQTNMRSCKVFFFDIDVDDNDDKRYLSKLDAITHLMKFSQDTGLARPMVVSSGGGLHVYWLLTREIRSDTTWLTIARKLRQLALDYGLKIDTARTTDRSSVLRVAGTFNHKKDLLRPVKVLKHGVESSPEEFGATVDAALEARDLVAEPPETASPVDDELGSNIERTTFTGTPVASANVYEACAQMRRIRDDKTSREPEWYSAIALMKFTAEGDAAAHELSATDPRYNYNETQNKIDQWRYGPPTCAKIALDAMISRNQGICANCAHVAKNSNPLSIARILAKAPPPKFTHLAMGQSIEITIPDPPLPYKRRPNGGVVVLMETKDGKQFEDMIYEYDLYPVERNANFVAEQEHQQWRAHLAHDEVRDFVLMADEFVDDRLLQKRLANVSIYPKDFSRVKQYMSAYIRHLQAQQPTGAQHNHLGWIENNSRFVLPDGVIEPDGTVRRVSLSKSAAPALTFMGSKGSLEGQVDHLTFYNDPRYIAHQFMAISGLGSILFRVTGHGGVVVNATGESGAGKSSAVYTAASFWGNPDRYVLNGMASGATSNARVTRMQILTNLPTCMDELTNLEEDLIKELAFGGSQKGGRERLDQKGNLRPQTIVDRSSMILTNANNAFHSILAQNNNAGIAGSVRVFEILFQTNLGVHIPGEASAYLRGLQDNYGHVGPYFATWVVKNRDKVDRRVLKVLNELEQSGKMRGEERFWFSTAASNLTTLEISKAMGLVSWDPAYHRDWLLSKQLPLMRGIVKEESLQSDPVVMLTDYLMHITQDIIKVSQPNPAHEANVLQTPRNHMLGHLDADTNMMDILKEGFRVYCLRHQQSAQIVLRRLRDKGIIVGWDVRRTLGRNTHYAKSNSLCFTIDLSHADIAASAGAKALSSVANGLQSNIVPFKGRVP